jgi:hypothetical protein
MHFELTHQNLPSIFLLPPVLCNFSLRLLREEVSLDFNFSLAVANSTFNLLLKIPHIVPQRKVMKNQLIFGLSVCLLLVAGLPADQGSIDDVASVKLNISMGHRTFPSKRQIQENQETQIMDIFEIWQDSLPDPSAMLSSDVWTMNIPFELDSLFSMMRRPQTLFELEFILPDEQSKNIIPLKTLPLNVGFMTTVRIGSDGREFSSKFFTSISFDTSACIVCTHYNLFRNSDSGLRIRRCLGSFI